MATNEDLKTKDSLVVLYGGRPATHKRIDIMLDVCRNLFAQGVPVTFELFLTMERTHGAEEKAAEFGKYSFVNLHVNRPVEEFLAACKVADAFVAASTAESYGISYVEMMAAGAVGVFIDRPWVRAILPKDYPYIVKDKISATAALQMIWEKKDTMDLRKSLIKFIGEEHDRAKHVFQVIEWTRQLSEAVKMKEKPTCWRDVI